MRNDYQPFFWMVLFLALTAFSAQAADAWRARASLKVAGTGIVETVVPPELVRYSDNRRMDLRLIGPEGQPRGFELYWRDALEAVNLALTPSQLMLDDHHRFVWEAKLPEGMLTRQLTVQLAARNAIGKINVQGLQQDRWTLLVKNAAIFKTEGRLHGRIDLPPAPYEGIRIFLSGYDRQAKQQLSPIAAVTAMGERTGKDYVTRIVSLPFQISETKAGIVLYAILPGDGLWLGTLRLQTEALYQGGWQLGRDSIVDGQKRFTIVHKGRASHINRPQQPLSFRVGARWPGSSLGLKLDSGDRYMGAITALEADVRLPRLVFAADKQGRYTLVCGTGQKEPVLNHPGDTLSQPDHVLDASEVEINPLWQPASLVDRYQLKGAPFDPSGYPWRAPVVISEPGYYQVALNLTAVLNGGAHGIRIVRDKLQVPYILGRIENQTIDLSPDTAFDAPTNQSQWTLQLPGSSDQWQRLTLHAQGIFRREIQIQLPKPGNLGWRPWRTVVWQNRDEKETALRLGLSDLPLDGDRLRLVMDNGDNQSVRISKITARYAAPTYYFLAHQRGTYLIYGGHPQTVRPRYDLSLIQNELLRVLPKLVKMGSLEALEPNNAWRRLSASLKDTGWGLYAVLGLVTLILVGVIVRLFPKGSMEE